MVDVTRLTGRGREVLDRLARGMSNPEIAEELYVTEDTVKSHVRRLCRTLGARDRAHAVALGYQSGLLTRESPVDATVVETPSTPTPPPSLQVRGTSRVAMPLPVAAHQNAARLVVAARAGLIEHIVRDVTAHAAANPRQLAEAVAALAQLTAAETERGVA